MPWSWLIYRGGSSSPRNEPPNSTVPLHPDELVGRQATDFVVESERDKFRASIGRLIEEGVHRNVEYTLLRKDGTTFDAEVSSAVISDAAGKPEALMAVYRDITERKQADEAMRQTLDQLANDL